ncbi:class I SAM-dependent methyltransferase [Actinomadura craniellae]|uniref:Class I SAM-dependent methyltransferase n=1 Tax=Actinomadura craniellae TaxID=2231787 RepID=A0A365H8T3_9ACTN|nr:methyltransferase domain-containing protein [Actinomadura craniellae]RAY15515.1 class I SAM-dependent methyltransferase [Actinomadura craniellae]
MLHGTGTKIRNSGGQSTPHLDRLIDFIEPEAGDTCLDLSRDGGALAAALTPHVHALTTAETPPKSAPDAPAAPRVPPPAAAGRTPTVLFTGPTAASGPATPPHRDGTFTLVTARFALYRSGDPARTLPEMLRVRRPGGRLIIAEIVRPDMTARDRGRIEQMRDPEHPGVLSLSALVDLATAAGATVRRLDMFTIERPLDPWLAEGCDRRAADGIRQALLDEIDGGPRTGARPRVIGGELWFTQSWAQLAVH